MEKRNRSGRRVWRATLLAVCLMMAPLAAQAESPATAFGKGLGTVVTNVVYGPVKLIYAIGGGCVAGVAWVFSGGDSEVSQPIVDASFRGDYILSRNQIFNGEPFEFVGRSPQHEDAREESWDVAAPADPEGF